MSNNLKLSSQTFILCIFLFSCNSLYKAGNLADLDYPIETSLKTSIVKRYVDTLIQNKGYGVPLKWAKFDKLVDLDSNDNKRIYFGKNPEEMYLISYGGMLLLDDVYNPNLNEADWVSKRDKMPIKEEKRIKERFKTEILDAIELLAKKDGLADSSIYK